MAEPLDVQNALIGLVNGVIYPNGIGAGSAQGIDAILLTGWPVPEQVDKIIANGDACIWVYCRPECKNVTRYFEDWFIQSIKTATFAATVSGLKITLSGSQPSSFYAQNAVISIGNNVFPYAIQANDTLGTIASALVQLISAVYPGATSNGAVITLPAYIPAAIAKIGTVGTAIKEVGRFIQEFQLVIAAPSPSARQALSKAITPALLMASFLSMPDGIAANIKMRSPIDSDEAIKQAVYRRDYRITGEYAVTVSQDFATIEAVKTTITKT